MAAEDKAAELTALVQEIRDRVRARYPTGGGKSLTLPDLMPLIHARDQSQCP